MMIRMMLMNNVGDVNDGIGCVDGGDGFGCANGVDGANGISSVY